MAAAVVAAQVGDETVALVAQQRAALERRGLGLGRAVRVAVGGGAVAVAEQARDSGRHRTRGDDRRGRRGPAGRPKERELRHVLRPPDDVEAFDEREDRRRSEPTEPEAFLPVAADVTPQMALFGPPAGVAPAGAPPDAAEPAMAAYERRELLRDRRHRLVADLRRSCGAGHAEINGWLNRSCGIRSVNDASIDQLERSIELLLGRLAGRR